MNKAEKIHCSKVAALGCYICGAESQLHHIRNDGTGNAGIGRKNSNFSVIPLCYNHHLGSFSIHNKKLLFEQRHGTEKEILQIITERLYGKKELWDSFNKLDTLRDRGGYPRGATPPERKG